MRKSCVVFTFLFLATLSAKAQIVPSGADPHWIQWKSLETTHYRVVYPQDADSLAREYAKSLEQYRLALKGSIGLAPNELYKLPMPVLLHSHSAVSNGFVTWAPRRMELYTTPDAYDPESTPWIEQLAIHENRHVAQMQIGRINGFFRTAEVFFGEHVTGALSGVYPGPALLEGDAVVAETALSNSGRGRTADFLEYWHVALSEGQRRDFWQWRWGSQKRYTPDYYRAGYTLVAGMRNLYDPAFMNRYYYRLSTNGFRLFNLQKTILESSGGLRLKDAFGEVQDYFAADWAASDSLRAPFVEGKDFTPKARLYDSYRSLTFADGKLLALHAGLDRSTELVSIGEDGKPAHLSVFSGTTSRLSADPSGKRIYWSEYRPSKVFEMLSWSPICYRDSTGKKRTLIKEGRWFNPVHSPDQDVLAAVRYYEDGSASVDLIDSRHENNILKVFKSPAGLQPVESAWVGSDLYVSGICSEGFGIWRVRDWAPVLTPAHSKINRLFGRNGLIWFTSDRSGVNELHSLDPASGHLLQRTSTRYGAKEFAFGPDGSLWYSAPTTDGRVIRHFGADSLLAKPVAFNGFPSAVAEQLSSQEGSLSQGDWKFEGEAEKYRKSLFGHLRPHSWAPLYINYNPVEHLTMETVENEVNLGAVLLIQNEFGTSYGTIGVSLISPVDTLGNAEPVTNVTNYFRPSFHAQYVWTGLGPIIELRTDINDRQAHYWWFKKIKDGKSLSYVPVGEKLETPSIFVSGNISLPLDFSGSGWNRGVIAGVYNSFSNDWYADLQIDSGSVVQWTSTGLFISKASLRAYAVQSIPPSCLFPRWGAGLELGISETWAQRHTRPGIYYVNSYAYLPGLMRTHGLRLQAGAKQSHGGHWTQTTEFNASADYIFPFAPVDWSFLAPVAYIRNFEGLLHAEGRLSEVRSLTSGYSESVSEAFVSATLRARLSNFLWLPYDFRIGVKYTYCVHDPSLSGFASASQSLLDSLGQRVAGRVRSGFEVVFSMAF